MSEIPHVTLYEGFYVVCVPVVSSSWCALLNYGVASANDALRERFAESSTMLECLRIAEEGSEKRWASAFEFYLRERVKTQYLHATC